jgi:predicted amidohydrolase YtcJ
MTQHAAIGSPNSASHAKKPLKVCCKFILHFGTPVAEHTTLPGMTLDPAWASFSENILGSITPGKRADFVVLSKDIMTITESEILSTKVLATAIDGRPAYGRI